MKKKVLVKEKISETGLEILRHDFDVEYAPQMSADELRENIVAFNALVIRSATQVTAEIIANADNLRVIGRAGVGVDNVDMDAATKRGIMVINAPQSNIVSAAEHTMALLLGLCRDIPQAAESLRQGRWERSRFQGVELYNKVLGIIGLGRVGNLVATRAMGFGMKVISYDPYVSAELAGRQGIEMVKSLGELLERSDFISIHLPKSTETVHLIGKKQFAKMKEGVRLINVARGGLIDEKALCEALKNGRVAGAALDVFENEPEPDPALLALPNVIATPHLGASTMEAQDRAGVMIAEQVAAALKGEFVTNVVNLQIPVHEVDETVKPFIGLAEKLGRLFTHLVEGHVDELEVEYLGPLAEHETGILTVAVLKGFFELVVFEPVTYVNAPIFAKERGIAVKESKSAQSHDYVNMINVRGKQEAGTVTVGGTLVGLNNTERFIHVYEYDIDLAPSQYMAFFRYEDVPGMIGKIGTILGANNINIAHMQVGRQKLGGEAVMGLNIDQPLSEDILDAIRTEAGVADARFIVLW
jgi:D-3-phosphoglycerate dehydrogenase